MQIINVTLCRLRWEKKVAGLLGNLMNFMQHHPPWRYGILLIKGVDTAELQHAQQRPFKCWRVRTTDTPEPNMCQTREVELKPQ